MLGRQDRWQEELFVAAPLRDLIPEDHVLRQVDRVLDLSWLRDEVRDCYDTERGRPGIDPEAALRLMLAGLFLGITHDRKLLREAQVNIAIRWFTGYRLTDSLPDHSSLTRIRQRWGRERFKRIFQRSVQDCARAGLVGGDTVHVDATLIRADVSWESLTASHVEKVLQENEADDDEEPRDPGEVQSRSKRPKKKSSTDPDASLATSNNQHRMEPSFKQHTAVDDLAGIIVDVHVTTGETSEGKQLPDQIKRIESNTGRAVRRLTADAAYAHAANYGHLEARGVDAVIPPQPENRQPKRIPARRFRYDEEHDIVRCPTGKELMSTVSRDDRDVRIFRAKVRDCRRCRLRPRCISPSAKVRVIRITVHQSALLRARRRRLKWDQATRDVYTRHRWLVEGIHGEEKEQHGLRRATRRGQSNVAIQVYLTAAVVNLKRLASAALHAMIEHVAAFRRAPAVASHLRMAA